MVTRTTERTANSHRERYPTNYDPDHGDREMANYSPDRSEAAHHDYAMWFEEVLNGQAQSAYRNRKDLVEFSTEDRKEVLGGWIEGFNSMQFDNGNQRLDAARDIAASVFRPYYDRIDAQEYEVSKLSSEELFDINVIMGANAETGASTAGATDAGQQNYVPIEVKNLEEAQRIVRETGGQARITYL